jgi:beta-glucanase (GH16 family)
MHSMSSFKWIALVSCGLSMSFSIVNAPAGPRKNKDEIVFFDDFSGKELDRNKWNVEITGNTTNNEQQAYVDSSATLYINNGVLVLQPRFSPGFKTPEGRSFDFISARINTRKKAEFTYGEFSAKIKLTDGAGLWPAWWLLGNGRWPQSGEIDIMEYIGEKDWASAAIHGPGYSGETPFVNRLYFPKGNDVTQWHVYTVDWTQDSLVFKYDDIPMFRVTRPMVEHYGKWAYDTPEFLLLNFALGGAYPVKINGVKTPYNGLAPATVEAIKRNECRMQVDWVKVVKKGS